MQSPAEQPAFAKRVVEHEGALTQTPSREHRSTSQLAKDGRGAWHIVSAEIGGPEKKINEATNKKKT